MARKRIMYNRFYPERKQTSMTPAERLAAWEVHKAKVKAWCADNLAKLAGNKYEAHRWECRCEGRDRS